ncbi:T9SS type B sorting domain-containing protein [Flavobacterium selenitireducens]|uniref:T9SS type B sorting domain-containing protein n=1 Tax=Flavobacterium selenitireducens TaxID=2722704 RepID=UPI00168B105B|nr:T9SS type B sorting domain-containing protein [Flavobacterium selenitireducens]MBD3581890.1 T9SS type B sorting domain-containing protein [Flavobacterium selenitireducens]
MSFTKTIITFSLLLISAVHHAQLGFCAGSKGDPLFTENFGNGTTYGPALPSGITTYTFIPGAPQDGQYTLYYHSSQYTTWHYSLDHTPDVTNGPNGKMLLVNANAVTSGDFYKKTVSGLCINTTFEFSAWLMNVYNPNTNYCGAGQIPINVRFEIWNADETLLLGSGNTGNIMGTPTPTWQQFALVFTTVNETSVVLKMKNNGVGGCGNDLAIDDIAFSSCGDLTTVTSPTVTGTTFSSCNSTSLELQASTVGTSTYFYQWQSSPDATTWTDIPGATNPTYITPTLTSLTYFRVKAAQDAANLSNNFCSAMSNVFTVSILPSPVPAPSNGDQVICSDEAITALSVTPGAGTGVNWYSAANGGTLLQSGSASYVPTTAGTYYAETYNLTSNCIASPRTPVSLTIIALPTATISGSTSICSGSTAVVSFSGTPNAILTYTVNGGANQTITLNASGSASITATALTADRVYTLISCASPTLSSCVRAINESMTISVISSPTAAIAANPSVCSGSPATVTFTGTPDAIVTYSVNGSGPQSVALDASGNASVIASNITSASVYTLIEVSAASAGSCTQALTQSITITPVVSPSATIAAASAVCSGTTAIVSFTGTPAAIIAYTVNSGPTQTLVLNASGTASITTSALTSNVTYALVSATSPVLGTCTTLINDDVTISVSPLPNATISSNAPVCHGDSATVQFSGTPNATVTYSQNGGSSQTIVLDGSGSASITTPSVTSPVTYSVSSVTSAGANGCTKPLSQSITVSTVPLPTASLTANPLSLCPGQSTTLTFNGTPNATVSYLAIGGGVQTATLDASGSAVVTTAALIANTTYQLTGIALSGSGCSQTLPGSISIVVNASPNVLFNGNLAFCDGDAIAINLTSNLAGTTFNWTAVPTNVAGAASGSGSQISDILNLQNAAVPGTVVYTVTPVWNVCAGNPVTISVSVAPIPVPQIADGVICTTGSAPTSNQFYTLDTQLSPANHSFQWFFEGAPIANASGSSYNANQIGVYTVIATNSAGCVSDPVDAVVGEMSQGQSLVIQQSEAFSDNPTITVTVIGGDGPFFYQLDDSGFQASNVFYNVTAGNHTVTVIDASCTYLTGSATVVNYPRFFTPNGDGFHDSWNISGVSGTISIFDRYGKLLKQIAPGSDGWDGTYNGSALPATDYWFSIDYAFGQEKGTFRAHFALKR